MKYIYRVSVWMSHIILVIFVLIMIMKDGSLSDLSLPQSIAGRRRLQAGI